jgi:hypothetical protein
LKDYRVGAHLLVTFVAWPIVTIVAAALEAQRIPYFKMSLLQGLAIAFASFLLLLPNFFVSGLALALVGRAIFAYYGVPNRTRWGYLFLLLEPVLLLLAITTTSGIFYPAVLGQGVFLPVSFLPVAVLLLELVLTVSMATRYLTAAFTGWLSIVATLAACWVMDRAVVRSTAERTAALVSIPVLSRVSD